MIVIPTQYIYCPATQNEDITVWVAIIISIIAIIATIVQSITTQKSNAKTLIDSHNKSVHDHFWIREIIVPKYIIPSLDRLNTLIDMPQYYYSIEECYISHMLPILNEIRDNFSLATSVSPALGQKLNELIDEMDDKITDEYISPQEEITLITLDVLKAIRIELSEKIISAIKHEQEA